MTPRVLGMLAQPRACAPARARTELVLVPRSGGGDPAEADECKPEHDVAKPPPPRLGELMRASRPKILEKVEDALEQRPEGCVDHGNKQDLRNVPSLEDDSRARVTIGAVDGDERVVRGGKEDDLVGTRPCQ